MGFNSAFKGLKLCIFLNSNAQNQSVRIESGDHPAFSAKNNAVNFPEEKAAGS